MSMIDRWGHRTLRAWVALSLIFIFQTNASASLTEQNIYRVIPSASAYHGGHNVHGLAGKIAGNVSSPH